LTLPKGSVEHETGPKNQILLASRGLNTLVRSWVPSGPIVGYIIRHGEAFSISDRLSVQNDNNEVIYRPTVHYAYCPCDTAIASLHELQMRNLEDQPKQRIMKDDIISGVDELGCLLMGDFGTWWIGSLLGIEETRAICPHQNATTMQVACSAVAAMIYAMRNPNCGVCLPDDLDHEEVLEIALPYLGPFTSMPSSWHPYGMKCPVYAKGKKFVFPSNFTGKPEEFVLDPKDKHAWQFEHFLVNPAANDL
jgi:homospermidine synthase